MTPLGVIHFPLVGNECPVVAIPSTWGQYSLKCAVSIQCANVIFTARAKARTLSTRLFLPVCGFFVEAVAANARRLLHQTESVRGI